MTPKARLIRVTVPMLLLPAVVLVGVGMRLTHHSTGTVPGTRYSGAVTLLQPGGWPSPAWPLNLDGSPYAGAFWDYLVDYLPNGSFFPELAAQVPSPANGGIRFVGRPFVKGQEVITFHLKPNARWSDGSPITAADYMAALLVGSGPGFLFGVAGANCSFHSARISGSTLVVALDGVNPEALEACDFTPLPWEYLQRKYHLILPINLTTSFEDTRVAALYAGHAYQGSALQRLIAKLNSDPYTAPSDLFNGPYRVTSWSSSQTGAGVAAPNAYFTALPADPHHPRPAQVRFVTPPGGLATGSRAIAKGAIAADTDVASLAGNLRDLSPPPVLQAHPPFQLIMHPLIQPEFLVLNQDNPALRDTRVRQALRYAIDTITYPRQTLRLNAAAAAAIADTSFFPHLMRFSIADQLPANLYNPAKARALLTAAGYATSPTGPGRRLRLDLYTTSLPARERGVAILARMWRRVGIVVTPHFTNSRSNSGLFSNYGNGGILARGTFAMAEYAENNNRDNGLFTMAEFDPAQVPDQNHPFGGNYGRVRDRALYSLLNQAQDTFDDHKRRQLYAQVQRLMLDQVYRIPLYDVPDPLWVRPTIGNFNANGGIANYFWNAYEWYVQ